MGPIASSSVPRSSRPQENQDDLVANAVPPAASAEERASLLALPRSQLVGALALMCRIRAFEEKVEELYGLGRIHGTMHLSIGQEAVPAGWSLVLEADDYLLSHHRGHGHAMAKGASPDRMMAELLGRQTGYGRGRGGSMHIADVTRGNLGANGIVGGGIPIATGLGIAIQMKRTSQLVLCVFGDGAVNQGAFHEALNLASIWNLPVLFLCENNQYAMSLPVTRGMRVSPAGHALAYAMPARRVDGNDVAAVRAAIAEATAAIRSGGGPWLIEAVTYRYRGHSKSDRNLYRTREEISEWRTRHDPIALYRSLLMESNIIDEKEAAAIEERARREIEEAVRWAEAQPEPRREDLLDGVYAE
jgi:TPP-dependent pyruvate/acetoin dehydrogenase alpha subunit